METLSGIQAIRPSFASHSLWAFACTILVGKPEGNKPLGRYTRSWGIILKLKL
jgi:hypothetical protein